MLLKELIIENFRGYKDRHRIKISDLTAFIGMNDAGKSSILDALAIFFDHPLGKIEDSDFCVHNVISSELRIGCVFTSFPTKIIIDSTSETSLSEEYLLNENGDFEIHKFYERNKDKKLKLKKILSICDHPNITGSDNLLSKKNSELKEIAKNNGITDIDRRSNSHLRKAIWEKLSDINLQITEIQLDKEDGKAIWEQLSKYLPEYALFRADRSSTDEDSEVQDPLKIAIKQAIEEVQSEIDSIKKKVQEKTLDVAMRTIEKLRDFDKNLASQLLPSFKTEPKWDGLFKLSLTGENEIPLNKRGSGVRRLVLFSFFRAESERLQEKLEKSNIIYAIEEPETAQHPHNQRTLINAFQSLVLSDGCQVLLTTHVPAIASLLKVDSVRYIERNQEGLTIVSEGSDDVMSKIVNDLGIIPDNRVKVLVCLEGPNDISFLRSINLILIDENPEIINLFEDPRVAIIPLGGSTLQEWVNKQYLKKLNLPEVHIYDRDEKQSDGTYKYQIARDSVNSRSDGSFCYLTQKREMENYLHIDAIKEVFDKVKLDISFNLTDDCDVEQEIQKITSQKKIQRRSIKNWLNEDCAKKMTIQRLHDRNSYKEINDWFIKISNLVSK